MRTPPYQTMFLVILVTLYLHLAVSTTPKRTHKEKDTFKYFTSKEDDHDTRRDDTLLELPGISNNKDIDVDSLKRARIPMSRTLRQRQHIGRALPNKGSYEDIGDGVYLVDDNNQKPGGKSAAATVAGGGIKGLSQQHVSSATHKIHSIDQDNRDIALTEASFTSSKLDVPDEQDFSKIRDVSAQESLQNNAVGFVGNDNLEGVSTNEKSMLKNIEKNLNLDDKLTGLNMEHEVETERRIEASQKSTKGLTEFQKIMLEGKKEFDMASSQADKDDVMREKRKRDFIAKSMNVTVPHTVHEWRNITGDVKPLLNGTFNFEKKSKIETRRNSKRKSTDVETSLHYEDVDDIDSNDNVDDVGMVATVPETTQGSKRNIKRKHKKFKNKNKKQRKMKKQKKGKNPAKAKSTKENKSKNEAKELAGLIKVLNKTDPSPTKLRLKPKQNTLTIDENTSKFVKGSSSVKSKEDGGKMSLGNSREVKITGSDALLNKRKTKSEVEEALDSGIGSSIKDQYTVSDSDGNPQKEFISVDGQQQQAPIEIGGADSSPMPIEESGGDLSQKSYFTAEGATSRSVDDALGGEEAAAHAIEGGNLNQQGTTQEEESPGASSSQQTTLEFSKPNRKEPGIGLLS